MPFIKEKDRVELDKLVDPLLEELGEEIDWNKRNAKISYVIYRMLMESTKSTDRIAQMFRSYGILESVRINLDAYFQNVDQAIMQERWVDGNAER